MINRRYRIKKTVRGDRVYYSVEFAVKDHWYDTGIFVDGLNEAKSFIDKMREQGSIKTKTTYIDY